MANVVFILQGNVSFGAAGIRQANRETVYQYRYIGELQYLLLCSLIYSCICNTHQQQF